MKKQKVQKFSLRWYADRLGISRSQADRLLQKYVDEGAGKYPPSEDALYEFAQRNAYYSNQWYNSPFYSPHYSP